MAAIGCYCRVSTEEQSLARQREATAEYAQDEFGVNLGEIDFYEDRSTGTDTDRRDYQQMMADVEAGELDAVVVKSISRIARSNRDLDKTVGQFVDHETGIHFIDEPIQVDTQGREDPVQRMLLQVLGAFAEFEAKMVQQRTREGIAARMEADEEYHHGRPPIGFESDNGKLYQNERYDQIGATLELVIEDKLSKRQAAHELNTSRKTIDRALERRELYGL